jgi:quinoprotein dehydrogenase-associated probable ABC transporter substrate-binding protein
MNFFFPLFPIRRLLILISVMLIWSLSALNSLADERKALKVCADPNSMPLSDQKLEGYENRIAEVLAADLGIGVEYTWFPQRRGFVRNTLRAEDPDNGGYKCDLIIGVPESFELAITAKPYYRSTYALVFKKNNGLDDVKSGQDFVNLDASRKAGLRVGIFEQTPAALWLARHGMIPQMVGYVTLNGDPAEYPGQIIERELLGDKIDAAILWGPIAGYFVNKSENVELTMIPLMSESGIRFDYAISMAVRFGEGEWKKELETLIGKNAVKIKSILQEYKVPLLTEDGNLM